MAAALEAISNQSTFQTSSEFNPVHLFSTKLVARTFVNFQTPRKDLGHISQGFWLKAVDFGPIIRKGFENYQ
jgi:hypothetical protein